MPSQGLRKYYSWGLWSRSLISHFCTFFRNVQRLLYVEYTFSDHTTPRISWPRVCNDLSVSSPTTEQCAGYKNSWIPQYCTPAKLAYPFSPTMAFLTDVPTLYKADLSDVLSGSTNGTKLNRSLSGTSNLEGKASFLGLLHIVALVPLSVASCRTPNSKPIAMWAWIVAGGAFQSMLLGAVLWTVMIIKFRSYINQVSNINSQGVPLGIEVESASGLSALWVTAITSLIANVAFGMVSLPSFVISLISDIPCLILETNPKLFFSHSHNPIPLQNFLAVRRRARQLSADTDLPPSLTYTYDNRTSMSSKEGYLQTDSKQMWPTFG